MGGSSPWTRTMEYDERTGRWVEVSPQPVEQGPAPDARSDAPREEPRSTRTSARRSQPANPLTGLLGGAMGGANSEFEVEPPEELSRSPTSEAWRKSSGRCADRGPAARAPRQGRPIRHRVERDAAPRSAGRRQDVLREAIAGEYRLNLIHVSTGDLVAGIQGQSAKNIDKAFQTALENLPCLLFFDEFDSVAHRR